MHETSSAPNRTGPRRPAAVAALGVLLALGAATCGGDDGRAAGCDAFTSCGGDPTGTWTVSKACFRPVEQPLSVPGCQGAKLALAGVEVTGSVAMTPDSAYTSTLSTTATLRVTVPRQCLVFQGIPLTCEQLPLILKQVAASQAAALGQLACKDAGDACDCTATPPAIARNDSGTFRVDGNAIVVKTAGVAGETRFDHCAQGKSLLVREAAGGPGLSGSLGVTIDPGLTILLKKP
jgi:hypothetical protein